MRFENNASKSRFIPLQLPLDEFIDKQANKNTASKTNRDVALFKVFLRKKEIDKEIKNLEAKELDEVLCAYIVEGLQAYGSWKDKTYSKELLNSRYIYSGTPLIEPSTGQNKEVVLPDWGYIS